MQRLLPRLVLFIGDVRAAISDGHRLARRHLAALRPGSISASSRSSPQTPSFLRVLGVRLEFGGLSACACTSARLCSFKSWSSFASKLYAMGFRSAVKRSTLADANESRNWLIWSDLAAVLTRRSAVPRKGARHGIRLRLTTAHS